MHILVINAGSSSLKYQYIDVLSESTLCSGMIDRIGIENGTVTHILFGGTEEKKLHENIQVIDHGAAVRHMAKLLTDKQYGIVQHPADIRVIGHRVVHGGEDFAETVLINEAVKENIDRLSKLAPLHNPANLTGIRVAEEIFPEAVQVAVFDTAFHQTLPPKAFHYAIPGSFYQEERIRVFGFHGISHKYVSQKAIAYLQHPHAKMIVLHLGNGCSMTAVKDGKSIDTSMGFGPLDGLIMGTRCGQLDPTVIFYLAENLHYDLTEINHLLNKQSGMKGLCGHSDMRDVNRLAAAGDDDASLASDMFAYRIKKFIGAYLAVMNGLDALVFTAGIGENDVTMREAVCRDLQALGIEIDAEKNPHAGKGVKEIQADASRVKILVIPTNEELEIAREAYTLIQSTHI